MSLIIKNGILVTAEKTFPADIKIAGEKISEIGKISAGETDEVIDASGCYVFPGGIDTHTHFDLNTGLAVTADNFASGTKAAIAGGVTAVIDYATQSKGQTLIEALKDQFEKARECYCDYGFHMGITDWNAQTEQEMLDLVSAGVTSFKMYMAYKNNLQVDDGVIYKALLRSREVQGLMTFHCENGDLVDAMIKKEKSQNHTAPLYHPLSRPALVEKEAVNRLVTISELTGAPVYVVHLSSQAALEVVKEAKNRGVKVYAETCPQYLLLDDSCYLGTENDTFAGAKYVMSPPLRKRNDRESLWTGLNEGVIETTGTDHCSFNYKGQKELGIDDFSKIPNGAPGVEHRMSLLYTYGVTAGRISLNQYVALTSTNAAKIFGLFPEKGTIALGADADLVIFDPSISETITASNQTQNVDYTPYEGFEMKGQIRYTLLRGQIAAENGKCIEQKPSGRYLKRKPYTGDDDDVSV